MRPICWFIFILSQTTASLFSCEKHMALLKLKFGRSVSECDLSTGLPVVKFDEKVEQRWTCEILSKRIYPNKDTDPRLNNGNFLRVEDCEEISNTSIMFRISENLTWKKAFEACAGFVPGSYLATVRNFQELKAFTHLSSWYSTVPFASGFSSLKEETKWEYVDNHRAVSYGYWLPGYPNCQKNCRCGVGQWLKTEEGFGFGWACTSCTQLGVVPICKINI